MLSNSSIRTLTILSQGMLVGIPIVVPSRVIRSTGGGEADNGQAQYLQRLLQEDEDILAIIYTFMKCR